MNIIAIIQARTSSTRLPNKVLLPLEDKPVLQHIVDRMRYSKKINNIVIATSSHPSDDSIYQLCEEISVPCFRGSLDDVLDRYYQAAHYFNASDVVRITADCPVIDPQIVDELISTYQSGNFDGYALAGEFPDGLDCQIYSLSTLERTWKNARLRSEREHIGLYIDKNPQLFNVGHLEKFNGMGHHRWTLDEPEDYEFMQIIYKELYKEEILFDYEDILKLLTKKPYLIEMNSHIPRNQGLVKNLVDEWN